MNPLSQQPLVKETVTVLRREIDDVFRDLDAWFFKGDDILAIVPPDVGWPMRAILEHVSLVNHFLLLTLRKGAGRALRRAERGEVAGAGTDLSIFSEIADPDSFDWQPPEHMIPTGSVSLLSVRDTLAAQWRECSELLDRMPNGEGALHTVQMSVRGLGRLDMYQWLYFLLMHARRHLKQMERAVAGDYVHVG